MKKRIVLVSLMVFSMASARRYEPFHLFKNESSFPYQVEITFRLPYGRGESECKKKTVLVMPGKTEKFRDKVCQSVALLITFPKNVNLPYTMGNHHARGNLFISWGMVRESTIKRKKPTTRVDVTVSGKKEPVSIMIVPKEYEWDKKNYQETKLPPVTSLEPNNAVYL